MDRNAKVSNRKNPFSELHQKDTLLMAIGNSSRSDDGLGWAFSDQLKATHDFIGEINCCYQLQIEDAEMISRYPSVIFVDACASPLQNGFDWEETSARNDFTFTTHALTPEAVLFLCNDLYQKFPKAYTLKIQGIHWELKTGLSDSAKENLNKAFTFFQEKVLSSEETNKRMSTQAG